MSSIDDIFAGDSLRAADIEGREPTVTIKSVEPREFDGRDGKKQRKLVISFHNAKKTFVCNKTNAQRIAYLHGKDYAKWAGKQITLFVDPFVEYGGQMTPHSCQAGTSCRERSRATPSHHARQCHDRPGRAAAVR